MIRFDVFAVMRSDIISLEYLTSLTVAQVISKARDFDASVLTDSAIIQQLLEEGAQKVHPLETNQKCLFALLAVQ